MSIKIANEYPTDTIQSDVSDTSSESEFSVTPDMVSSHPSSDDLTYTSIAPHQLHADTSFSKDKGSKRRRLSPDETRILVKIFETNPRPTAALRDQLARQLGMTNRNIQIWFQNRRAKSKKEATDRGTTPQPTYNFVKQDFNYFSHGQKMPILAPAPLPYGYANLPYINKFGYPPQMVYGKVPIPQVPAQLNKIPEMASLKPTEFQFCEVTPPSRVPGNGPEENLFGSNADWINTVPLLEEPAELPDETKQKVEKETQRLRKKKSEEMLMGEEVSPIPNKKQKSFDFELK